MLERQNALSKEEWMRILLEDENESVNGCIMEDEDDSDTESVNSY